MMDFRLALQLVLIIIALGIAAVLVFGSLAVAAYFLVGTHPVLSTAATMIAGTGAGGGAIWYLRRRGARRQTTRGRDDVGEDDR
ncbi:MAG TPA: hypothetical protein VJT31_34990 [Rugosimonospora sp.]|nr:hypothetical protein [Rugosimonospora sp.]